MKDKLDGKIMARVCCFESKTYNYLIDDDEENIKAKDTKKYVYKTKT